MKRLLVLVVLCACKETPMSAPVPAPTGSAAASATIDAGVDAMTDDQIRAAAKAKLEELKRRQLEDRPLPKTCAENPLAKGCDAVPEK